MPTSLKPYLIVVAIALSFGAGYKVSNWHEASIELVAQKAADGVAKQFQGNQKEIADNVQKSLDDWRQNNVIVQEKITREKLQPVFSNVCVTPEYVKLFNQQTNSAGTSSASQSSAKAGN